MSEYTLSTEDVRIACEIALSGLYPNASRRGAFDRWLGQVKAEAWDEGFAEGVNHDLGDRENAPSIINNPLQTGSMNDAVNHPAHYNAYPVEVIEITEHMNFCRGNAVKYIARAGLKSKDTEIEDLEKARWYIEREIERVKGAG